MDSLKVKELICDLSQPHLLEGIEDLSQEMISRFIQELLSYGKDLLIRQRSALLQEKKIILDMAVSAPCKPSSSFLRQQGLDAVASGAAACVILAGGMGSRLGITGPKGLCPISPVKHKTLFQIHFEKIRSLSDFVGRSLPVAVMVSSKNAEQTKEYLHQNNFFGLSPSSVYFVCQKDLPFLSPAGDWMLERPGALASGPDGNGGVFNVLEEAGLLSQWNETGVKYLCVMQVDNPLAEPFDFDLIGAIVQEDSDGAIKAVQRKDPLESVGMIVDIEGKVSVAEYSDLSMMQRTATTPLGELLFPLANTGIMCFSLDFVQRALQLSDRMPWHLAHKTASIWSASLSYHKEPIVKFETFIFDVFALARRISVISANRGECYSPLKNKEGDKGIAAVQKDLLAIYKRMYTALSGLPAPERDFELGPAFAYPTAIMQQKWKGKALPDSEYIDS